MPHTIGKDHDNPVLLLQKPVQEDVSANPLTVVVPLLAVYLNIEFPVFQYLLLIFFGGTLASRM